MAKKRPIKVGLTGGIGAGKSTVARLFESLGVPVYYADKEAKRLMWKDVDLKAKIKSLFGKNAYHSNGRVNRAFLANAIFSDKRLLKKINSLVHPAVHADLAKWMSEQKGNYAIEEAALIFESKGEKFFDKIICVSAPKEIRIHRVMLRDKISREQVEKRLASQLSQESKEKKSNFIIKNDLKTDLLQQVMRIHKTLDR